ncbi:MAG: GvpD gas vesicle protein [Methanosaeta sp. PtaU1.Bin055]|jgi:KaiC/GvpD/RAD55 family RecA-like ATPase|nr:MAG: GvpD gas vesicle protein [Methanosaeta sp. PtaU1.Bin055]
MRIPSEIHDFFRVEEGQTLLIKGMPGTGKTTLALEIMCSVCERENGMYISTRVNPSRVYAMFPWIGGIIPTTNVVNATQKMLLESLRNVGREGSSYETVLYFFKTFLDQAGDMDDPMIVIDSWDAIINYTAATLGDAQHSLEQNICEFARDMGIHLIFVSESADLLPLDYIVDGVVTLKNVRMAAPLSGENRPEGMTTRYSREIRLDKLRGVEIKQKIYTCTLHDGRFCYFEPALENVSPKIGIVCDLDRISDPREDSISTGIGDFDGITGGLNFGSCNVLEIDHGVGKRYYQVLTALASNSVKNGRAVHIVPSIGYQLAPRDVFVPSNVMVLEPGGDRDQWYETLFKHWDSLRERTGRPILNILGLDSMEFAFGYERMLNSTSRMFQKWKETSDVNVVVVKSGQKSIRMTSHIADTYFVIKELNGGLCLYGLIPRTEPHYMVRDERGNIRLVPIV